MHGLNLLCTWSTPKPSKNIPLTDIREESLISFFATFWVASIGIPLNACGGRSSNVAGVIFSGIATVNHRYIRKNRQKPVIYLPKLYDKVLYLQLLMKCRMHSISPLTEENYRCVKRLIQPNTFHHARPTVKDRLIKETDNKSFATRRPSVHSRRQKNGAACVRCILRREQYRLLVNASMSAIGAAENIFRYRPTQKYRIQRGDLRCRWQK